MYAMLRLTNEYTRLDLITEAYPTSFSWLPTKHHKKIPANGACKYQSKTFYRKKHMEIQVRHKAEKRS